MHIDPLRDMTRPSTTWRWVLLLAFVVPIVIPSVEAQHDHGKAGGSHAMHQSMMAGMKQMQAMKMTGDVDCDFATMMTHHHKHGIEMAEIELRDGKDDKMKAMARKIVDSQKAEIREFEQWLASKGCPKKN